MHGDVVKWPLKRLLEEFMPADFIYRKKSGFVPPFVRWLTDPEFNEKVRGIVLSRGARVTDVIPSRILDELLTDARNGRRLRFPHPEHALGSNCHGIVDPGAAILMRYAAFQRRRFTICAAVSSLSPVREIFLDHRDQCIDPRIGLAVPLIDDPCEPEHRIGDGRDVTAQVGDLPGVLGNLPRVFGRDALQFRDIRGYLGVVRSQQLQLPVDAVVAFLFFGSHRHIVSFCIRSFNHI